MKRSGSPVVCLVATIALLVPLAANAADPNCWVSAPTSSGIRQWHPGVTIPVYIGIGSGGVQNIKYDPSTLALALQTAIERWNEQTGTTIHLTYGGMTTSSPTVNGGILILGSPGCSNFYASSGLSPPGSDGYSTTGTISLSGYYYGSNGACTLTDDTAYGLHWYPQELVDMLVHELGHAMGRTDAYSFPTSCDPNACGTAHNTVMSCAEGQDLTDFDRTDHQSVYGDRASATTLSHMTQTAGSSTWAAVVVEGSSVGWEAPPGSGSSYQTFDAPVPLVGQVGSSTQVVLNQFRWDQAWENGIVVNTTYVTRHPVSSSFAPNGSAIMAYVADTGSPTSLAVCHRLRDTSGVWGAESCLVPNANTVCTGIVRDGVSTAYDPSSGRFLIANQCYHASAHQVVIRSIAPPGCTNILTCQTTAQLFYAMPAETPTMACSDYTPTTEPLWSNCRVVWAQRDVYGQPIAWKNFGIDSQHNVVVNPTTHTAPGIFSDHAPSVAWFNNAFEMAVVRFGQDITLYSLGASASATSWTGAGTMNSTGWVSAPYLATTHGCRHTIFGNFCSDKLNLFWLNYPVPQ